MTPDRIESVEDDVRYIRARVDDCAKQIADLRVVLERRVTTLEVKSGLYGLLGGFLAALSVYLARP